MFRLSQTLNVFWEKTPESVLYAAVQAAVDGIDDVQLVDFTSTENVCLSHLPGFYTALLCCSDVKSSRPKWLRGQNFGLVLGLGLGLGLKHLASVWPRSRCLIM